MIAQRLLPAFAVLTIAAAQSSICSQATATINSQADATAYADCTTISGSVLFGPGAGGIISLDGPQQIKGDFICADAGALTSLGSSTVNSITGSFSLNNLTLLSTLSMGALSSVGQISWTALPALSQLAFAVDVKKAKSVLITNTFLSTLEGINLDTVAKLDINNNNRLKTFSTQVGNITDTLNIAANGRDLAVEFPNLIWASNMTFRNISSIKIPSLATVNGSLGFYGNYMNSVMAPNLTSVGSFSTGQGSLAFVANGLLANISMPLLKSVGGANQIANNSGLNDISFPALTSVGGAVDFSGNFSTPQLPILSNVKGGFNMQSVSQIDCSGFQALRNSQVIQGTYTCKTTADVKSGTDGGSSTTGSSPTASGTKNAAVSYGATAGVAGLSVMGGLLQMLL